MFLRDFVDVYSSHHDYGLRPSSVEFLRASVGTFDRWAGRPVLVSELDDQLVNRYLDWLRTARANATFRTNRGALKTLWLAAVAAGLNCTPPLRLRKHRAEPRPVKAWTPGELLRLLAAADELGSENFPRSRIRKRPWFRSLIVAAYDSGLRLGDLLQLRREEIRRGRDGFGRFAIVTSKTRETLVRELTPYTMAELADHYASSPAAELVWPLWGRRDAFYRQFRRLVRSAGVSSGTFRYVRRCAVTQGELEAPGRGSLIAGHRCRRVTLESYLDASQMPGEYYRPPDLLKAAAAGVPPAELAG